MKKLLLSLLLLLLVSCTPKQVQKEEQAPILKPRIVVMTDIGPADVEPDDNESTVRLLSYADRFEIEAIITTVGWNCDPYPSEWADYLHRVVEGYKSDVNNLMKRSQQTTFKSLSEEETEPQELGYWPSYDYIKSRCYMGSQKAGIGVIGEDNDTDGSRAIIKLVDEADERPIWFLAWGSGNTLSQAIWRVKQERSPEELKKFLNKCRLYTITDQDMVYAMRMQRDYSSHMWLRKEFSDDLMLVWDESAWLNQNELGKSNWDKYAAQIQGHGEMGKCYPTFLWGVEGDTPSFLHVMPNGLNDPDDPKQVGWGGMHLFGISPDNTTYCYTNWQQPLKDLSNEYEHHFYPDEYNDFAARIQWAETGEGNHNPLLNPEGDYRPIVLSAKAGESVVLDLSKAIDPDGDNLSFNWWIQTDLEQTEMMAVLFGQNKPMAEVNIHNKAAGKEIHVIAEVHDDGPYDLVSYQRYIIKVK